MDGNGRWAEARRLPRLEGHRRGAAALRRTVEAAPGLGIGTLTVYAFSSDNWKRPAEEVSGLLRLLERYLAERVRECVEQGVRLSVIGRRDRLPPALLSRVEDAERATAQGTRLHLRIAIDYSARDLLLRAASAGPLGNDRAALSTALARVQGGAPAPDVDLLIRTGGEQRLSDFLLWECAYAELLFTPTYWPDFDAHDLERAVAAFHRRQRRFGAVGTLEGRPCAATRNLR